MHEQLAHKHMHMANAAIFVFFKLMTQNVHEKSMFLLYNLSFAQTDLQLNIYIEYKEHGICKFANDAKKRPEQLTERMLSAMSKLSVNSENVLHLFFEKQKSINDFLQIMKFPCRFTSFH